MRRIFLLLMACFLPIPALGEILAASRTIRSLAIIAPSDLTFVQRKLPSAFDDPSQVIGLEARRVIYAGQPILPSDVGPPALIERNQIVPIIFQSGGLVISAEGRSLGRGALGERLRVMNLHSKSVVSGTVTSSGAIRVGN